MFNTDASLDMKLVYELTRLPIKKCVPSISSKSFHHVGNFYRQTPVLGRVVTVNKFMYSNQVLGVRKNKGLLDGVETIPVHQRRVYHSGDWGENEDVEERDIDFDKISDELLTEDYEYRECVQHYCNVPDSGHNLYVVQPVSRKIPQKYMTSTGSLMLEEACALVNTLPRWRVVGQEHIKVTNPAVKHVFGPGQLDTLTGTIKSTPGVSAVFISVEILSQIQLNALQRRWKLPVFDRYTLVLQIFKEHARSKEAKLQIALAEVPLVRSRIEERHLNPSDRMGRTHGVQIPASEADFSRYMQSRTVLLQAREKKLQLALTALKKQRAINRQNRVRRKVPTVAVIGYTNSGKTTLIKALTGDEKMIPQNCLFATLDVTAHPGLLPNRMTAVFMDTVGFISNIPVKLYNAFAATLEDAVLADLIVHVRDISHPDTVAQKENVLLTVQRMLSEQQLNTMIEVCNKMDKLPEQASEEDSDCFYISSVTGDGLEELRVEIQNRLLTNMGYLIKKMRVPLNGPHLQWLYKEATVTGTENDSDYESIIVHVVISEAVYAKFMARFGPNRRKNAIR